MPNYANSIIYTIKIKDDNSVYIGSTTQVLKERFTQHKNPKETTSVSKYIKEKYNGDWSVVFIEEYEKYPCSCKKDLNNKEGEIIRLFKDNQEYNCLNEIIQGRDKKQYYIDNKEYIDKKNKEYGYKHKEEAKERNKKHYELNKEKKKEYAKKYREENRDKCRGYALKCYYKNKDNKNKNLLDKIEQ